MCQLGVNTHQISTTQLDPSLTTPTTTSTTTTPSTGNLGTDELSIGHPSSSPDQAVRASVDELSQTSHTSSASASPALELSSSVSAAPPRADAVLVAEVAKAAVPAPSLKDVLNKAGTAQPPKEGSTTEPVRAFTSAEVRAKYGEAKDDIKIFGAKIYGMSTEYKGILKALDAYHDAAAKIDVNTALDADLKKLNDLLDRADFAIKSYHGKREGVGDLSQGIAQERAFLLKAKAEGAPDGVSFADASAALQEKQLGQEGPQYQAIMADARGLQGFLDKIPVGNGSGAAVKTLSDGLKSMLAKIDSYGGNQPEIKELRASIVDAQRRLDLLQAHPELIAGRKDGLYQAMNWGKALQVAPGLASGLSGGQRADGEAGKLRELGKGAVNTVYVADFKNGADVKTGVVKFDLPAFPSFFDPSVPVEMQQYTVDAPDAANDLRMDTSDPQLLQRAVASDDVAKALDLPIRVPVRMAVIDGSLAGIMDKAPGVSNDKRDFVTVMNKADVEAHAKVKLAAYAPMEARIGEVQQRLSTQGHDEKLIGGLFKDIRTRVQTYSDAPKGSDIAGMSPSAFKSAFGAVVLQNVGNERHYFSFVQMEGGIGKQRVTSGGVPVEGQTPTLLMTTEEFAGIVTAGNEGRALVDTDRDRLLSPMKGWQHGKAKEILDRGAGANGKIDDNGLRGMKQKDDGSIAIERDLPFDIPYDDPGLVQQLTNLHLADFLTGQLDRHQGNYFVDKVDGRFTIAAIDGDFSWGDQPVAKPTEGGPKYIAPHSGFNHSLDLPPVIDSGMQQAILSLRGEKLEQLRTTLGEKLTATQLEAFDERLAILQAHVVGSEKCRVISPDAWGTDPSVKEMLKNPGSSYAARELRLMGNYEKAGIPTEAPPWR